jgi:gliding motility-associated-like protein
MRLIVSILFFILLSFKVQAQDFTNRGKEFWLCFPSHTPNVRNNVTYLANMSLFITSDRNSTGTVAIPGVFSIPFSVTANQVTEVSVPYSDAHITSSEAGMVLRKGIQVKTDAGKPGVVVYAHIYAGFRSAASLVLPKAVLGKKYYSMNAPQLSVDGSKSQFVIVGADTATTIKITPRRNGIVGTPFEVTLPLPGDLYEMQSDDDLTGSAIESISVNGLPCKNMAVFSGSSGISIVSDINCRLDESFDPLYQQLYPVSVWGNEYGFVPFKNYTRGNPYRVLAAENNTNVLIDGTTVATLNEGEYYPSANIYLPLEANPKFITSSKPVSVAQYAQSSACSGTPGPTPAAGYGDPDMVLLNPIEQNVNDITIFSSNRENIYSQSKFINVLIKNTATASFTINGVPTGASWQSLPAPGAGYAYTKITLPDNQSTFKLSADSAFNAIAYGFGDFESYAYSAGTNVKDLYRTLAVENEFGTGTMPIGCSGRSFRLSFTFPYIPVSIKVQFNGLFPDELISNPVPVETFILNGKTVYRFRLTNSFTANTNGTFPISIIGENASQIGCNNGFDENDYEITIVEKPRAYFNFNNSGCVLQSVNLIDSSDAGGTQLTNWHWKFGDNSTSTIKDPSHTYTTAGTYTVEHWAVSTIGCGTDTASHPVHISDIPIVTIDMNQLPVCEGANVSFSSNSSVNGNFPITAWNWDFGDNNQLTATTPQPVSHIYTGSGNYTATLQVKTATGCASIVDTKLIEVKATPVADFSVPVFCLPAGSGTFTNQSTISDGTGSSLIWDWNFGDNSTSTNRDPLHNYLLPGPYTVRLTATSITGCTDDTTIVVTTIYPQARLTVSANAENCLGSPTVVSANTISTSGEGISTFSWRSNTVNAFVDTVLPTGATIFSPSIIYNTPGPQTVQLYGTVTATGCKTDTVTKNVYINRLPVPGFSISSPLCEQSDILFSDTSRSQDGVVVNRIWDFGNGPSNNSSSVTKQFTTGNHTVSLQVETAKGCMASISNYGFTINPLPVANFETPGICLNDPFAQFTNQSTIRDGTGQFLNYHWRFGDANATVNNPDTSIVKDPQHQYTSTGNYSVTLTAVSNAGCRHDSTKVFTVNGIRPSAGFSFISPIPFCNTGDLQLRDTSSVEFGNIIRTNIVWGSGRDILWDSLPLRNKVYHYHYLQTDTATILDTIRYTVYSGITCKSELVQPVIIKAYPALVFNRLNPVCQSVAPFTINAFENSGLSGFGSWSGNGINTAGLFNPNIVRAGNHLLTYTFNAANGCMASASQPIHVLPMPSAWAGPDKFMIAGGNTKLDATASGNQINIQWSPPLFIDNSTVVKPIVHPDKDITYVLQVTSVDGCIAKDEVLVKIIDNILVPTAFTPNNDFLNDKWVIPHIELFENCIVQIFNRAGERVFYSTGYKQPWDGTLRGEALPIGAYVWMVDLKNGRKPMSGIVTLIR